MDIEAYQVLEIWQSYELMRLNFYRKFLFFVALKIT